MHKMIELPAGGSAARNPDLDWSQVRETMLMLGIAVAQVRHAVAESNASLNALAFSFADTHDRIEALRNDLLAQASSLPAELDLDSKIAEIGQRNMQAVIAFQFYDRLSQRLDHVCGTISGLAELVSDRNRLYVPSEWMQLQDRIRSQYSMEQEKKLFDDILNGMDIRQALSLAASMVPVPSKENAGQDSGDIELF
jgi:hypothetical protein